MTMQAESGPLDDEVWGEDRGAFTVDSLIRADWAGRKLIRAETEMAKVADEFDAAIKQWQDSKAKALTKSQRDVDYFRNALNLFLFHEVEQDEDGDPTKAKTIDLPCGVSLAYRPNGTGAKRLVIEDPATLVDWCAANLPDALEAKLVNRVVKDAITKGAPIPGAHLEEPDSEPFRITTPKREQA